MNNKTYFISGHGDLTDEEFKSHYKPLIDDAVKNNACFILGDFKGCDKISHDYLVSIEYQKVTVYHMFDNPRFNTKYPCKSGYKTDNERDEDMTRNSDKDIAWVRIGKEKSGTALNLFRRILKDEGS